MLACPHSTSSADTTHRQTEGSQRCRSHHQTLMSSSSRYYRRLLHFVRRRADDRLVRPFLHRLTPSGHYLGKMETQALHRGETTRRKGFGFADQILPPQTGRREIPQSCCAVFGGRNNTATVRRHDHAADSACVSPQDKKLGARHHIPHARSAVASARDDARPVGTDCNTPDCAIMTGKPVQLSTGCCVPDPGRAVVRCCDDARAVLHHGDSYDPGVMTLEHHLLAQ